MITLTAGQLWGITAALAAGLLMSWALAGALWRAAARAWRNAGTTAGRLADPGRHLAPETARPQPPQPGITLHVPPCGCVYYYKPVQVDRCGWHTAQATERAEINRLDQQIRNMP